MSPRQGPSFSLEPSADRISDAGDIDSIDLSSIANDAEEEEAEAGAPWGQKEGARPPPPHSLNKRPRESLKGRHRQQPTLPPERYGSECRTDFDTEVIRIFSVYQVSPQLAGE